MKTKTYLFTLGILLAASLTLTAQVSDKRNPGNNTESGQGRLDETQMEKTTFTTSRMEDIEQVEELRKLLQTSKEANNKVEAEAYKRDALPVMLNEIARSKNNLRQLKAGDTQHLEQWLRENKPGYPMNVGREIQTLTNRVNYEKQVYRILRDADLTQPSGERIFTYASGYLNGFKRAMERNLRYESDKKTVVLPPEGDTHTGGPVIITQKGNDEAIGSNDPRMQSWLDSKKQRKEDYAINQADFEKYAGQNDDDMARRSYQKILQLMMDEINSANWLMGQIGMGNIEKGGVDVNNLAATVKSQQKILSSARELKVSTPESLKANKDNALGLIRNFGSTL